MPMPRILARFNRVATNKVSRLWAGRAPGQCLVVHVGRTTGRNYRTPVWLLRDGESFRFSLTYGAQSDWVRNVLAAGRFDVEHGGRLIALENPVVHSDPSMRWAPAALRPLLRRLDAPDYLDCRVVR